MTLLYVTATLIATLTSLYHVTAVKCLDATASANCSFAIIEPCSEAYTLKDEHGLRWVSNTGGIPRTNSADDYYGDRPHNVILSASGFDRYVYLRGTADSRAWGIWTDLISPPVNVYGGCLHYMYHNSVCGDSLGSNHKKLKVMLRSEDNDNVISDRIVREYSCINDTLWYSEHVSLSEIEGTFKIVFSAQHHGWTDQSVAIDHVIYTHESCSLRDDVNFDNGDCDWEYDGMCGYQRSEVRPEGLRWEIKKQSQLEAADTTLAMIFAFKAYGQVLAVSGKANRSTTGDLISHSSNSPDDLVSVSVSSPKVHMRTNGCLVLNYYSGRHDTNNNNVTALVVKATRFENGTDFNILRELPSTLGNELLKQFVPLPKGDYSLMFTARLLLPFGDLVRDFIAIDDVEIFHQSCDQIQCEPILCEDRTKCNNFNGRCIGRGLKHYTCRCTNTYIGKSCQFDVPYGSMSGFAVDTMDMDWYTQDDSYA